MEKVNCFANGGELEAERKSRRNSSVLTLGRKKEGGWYEVFSEFFPRRLNIST